MLFFRTFVLLNISVIASAILPFDKKAPYFYKSSKSLFPSGQLSEDVLESKMIRAEKTSQYQVEWEGKEFPFNSQDLARDIHVSLNVIAKNSFYASAAKANTGGFLVQKDTILKVVDIENETVTVQNYDHPFKVTAQMSDLAAYSEDFGVGLTYMSTLLRSSIEDSSPVLTTIPQGTRLTIIDWKNEKVQVHYQNHVGYIDSGHLVLKADFATVAIHKTKGWVEIKHREGAFVRTKKNELEPISEIKAFVTDPMRAFSLLQMENGPKLRSRLQIKTLEPVRWNISRIPEHGDVWWKKTLSTDDIHHLSTYTYSDLVKRNILWKSHGKTKGLASANGIFRTENGIDWLPIAQFENQNLPVAVTKAEWYVGTFRSRDDGKTFEPFIRWDTVSNLVSQKYNAEPDFFKVIDLTAQGTYEVKIQMDIGSRKINLLYNGLTSEWKVL